MTYAGTASWGYASSRPSCSSPLSKSRKATGLPRPSPPPSFELCSGPVLCQPRGRVKDDHTLGMDHKGVCHLRRLAAREGSYSRAEQIEEKEELCMLLSAIVRTLDD